MNKLLDLLAEIEAEAEWSIYDGNDNEKIMGLIHQAMDIAVQGKAHKWPEEKPEKGNYLIARRYKYEGSQLSLTTGSYWFDQLYTEMIHSPESDNADDWGYIPNPELIKMCWYADSDGGYRDISDEVVYWWNLPEVTE